MAPLPPPSEPAPACHRNPDAPADQALTAVVGLLATGGYRFSIPSWDGDAYLRIDNALQALTDLTIAVDWRSDYDALTYQVIEPPADVVQGVKNLMSTLGLRFGALDFLVTRTGEWYFLEINPNGQWAWIEQETGLAISSAIADALTTPRPPA